MRQISKREKLEVKIYEMVKEILDEAEDKNNLDHFEFTVKNHEGTIQSDRVIKRRSKAY